MISTQALSPHAAQTYAKLFLLWQSRGLSVRASGAAALAGCDTVDDIARLGRSYFEGLPNCGPKTLAELSTLAGWPPKQMTAADAIAAALALSFSDPEEAQEVAVDALIALRRSGFAVVAARRDEA